MKHHTGSLEVITGSMFCGKTDELIRRLRRATIARQKVQVFKPSIDIRYAIEKVKSHAGGEFDALPIKYAREIPNSSSRSRQLWLSMRLNFSIRKSFPLYKTLPIRGYG